ncbi:alginate lyase family protein [Stappia sp. F7233]|uniref:Alginate lyase family protein n=1 Tax=Stappia albiluteola TaxID=2758565 RepID=A0A839A9S5_9HYPH|nr:alginate lyase family protein [Stappia albiluteola]MBA5775936.1 alginate lyase family protein [Stappia albiluteola]
MARSIAGRVAWYARRLSAMSGAEIAHRFAEVFKKRAARNWPSGWRHFEQLEGPLPLFPAAFDLDAATDADIARWRGIAAAARARRFSFLGVEWPETGRASLWHFDPVKRREWPKKRYCFAINYRHTGRYGDVKYVWEVNRLQYLQPIAALAARTGDRELAGFVAGEIESWIDANPPFLGINWPSGIELALRAISVLIAARLLERFPAGWDHPVDKKSLQDQYPEHILAAKSDSDLAGYALGAEAFTPAQQAKVRAFLVASAAWIHRYPSRFSSANNHLIAEAVGLFVVGTAYADHGMAGEWRRIGRDVLEQEAGRQFHDDGIGAEQSPTYSAFTLELYLLAMKTAEAAGEPFSEEMKGRVARAAEALSWFLDEKGMPPRIGDDDEGRVVFDGEADGTHYVASVVASAASLLGRPDIAPPVAPSHLRTLLFGSRSAATHERPRGVKVFRSGGYTVLRERDEAGEWLIAMDHGPLGYLSIAAHGHADTLALWLHRGGHAVFADAGTYLYHSGGAWRDAFRGTPVHNTLSVAGRDSSLVAGAFNWREKAEARLLSVDETPEGFRVEASHDGYLRRFGVTHRRSLRRLGPREFEVEDALDGTGTEALAVTIGFLAGEGVAIVPADGGYDFVADGRRLASVIPPATLSAQVIRGLEQEKRGWISPRFGVRVPADQLVLAGKVKPGDSVVTRVSLP